MTSETLRTKLLGPLAGAALAATAAAMTDRAPEPTQPRAVGIEALDQIRPGQQPLIREGSVLMQVRGTFHHESETHQWRFLIAPQQDDATDGLTSRLALTMLPNRYLSDIERLLEASRDSVLTFELSGRVFVYRLDNYLLLTSPPRVVSDRLLTQRQGDTPEETASEAPEAAAERSQRTQPRGARELMEEMERETGALARGMALRDEDRGDAAHGRELIADGTSVVQRRGRLSRDASGTLRFVFDADASGLADPPMTLLPCLLLEQLEEFARSNDPGTPLLMSGQVSLYEGRNFLLPTMFLQPRERTALHP